MEMQQYLDTGSHGSSVLLLFSIVTVPAGGWVRELPASSKDKLLVSFSEMLSPLERDTLLITCCWKWAG